MSAARTAMRLALGRRLPRTRGTLTVKGLSAPLRIRRDRWGVPHVDAANDADAAFAAGFCHGQDRAFQLETLLRAGRGTLSELIGPDGLPMDRVSRRMGLRRSCLVQLEVLDAPAREAFESYARGVNAAFEHGLPRPPHELAILRRPLTPWTAADSLGAVKLLALGLATNWDIELGRLRVLQLDGEQALRDVDPSYPDWLPVTLPPGSPAGAAVETLARDAAALAGVVGGGGSNNWAISPGRTATGRPLLANDPHLGPQVPNVWYLIDVRTPDWHAAGASVAGVPGVTVGHNDTIAWGATNSGADVVDLYVEEVSDDGASVRGPDGPEPCELVHERIEVKGAEPVVESVLLTPRGPIVTPALEGDFPALSMRALFLHPLPLSPVPALVRSRSLEDFRDAWRGWPVAPVNLVYADTGGRIAYQLAGQVPRRERGRGTLPQPAWEPSGAWQGLIELDELPATVDPPEGFVATANNKPVVDGEGPFLGVDWMDGYRVARVSEELAAREDWDVEAAMALQLDRVSIPWGEMSGAVLGVEAGDARARRAQELLRAWDGEVSAESPAAAVFELFVAEMGERVARARAPHSHEWALGDSVNPVASTTYQGLRWVGHLSRLLRDGPDGWLEAGWDAEISVALSAAVSWLERHHGSDSAGWAWGTVRPLTLVHAFGGRRPFDKVFNLGPIPWGGDTNTAAQAAVPPLTPSANPLYLGTLRMAIDVGEWERSLFILAGGQSGNPLSPHYDDQFEVWRTGGGITLPWSEEAVAAATRDDLRLEPAS